SGEAAVNYRIVSRTKIPCEILAGTSFDETSLRTELGRADWVVDALFGNGLTGPVRAPLDRVIAAINAGPARVFAVDIPSGLDCDTGEPIGETIKAEHTATFVAMKQGFLHPHAAAWLGQVHVLDIPAPHALIEECIA